MQQRRQWNIFAAISKVEPKVTCYKQYNAHSLIFTQWRTRFSIDIKHFHEIL